MSKVKIQPLGDRILVEQKEEAEQRHLSVLQKKRSKKLLYKIKGYREFSRCPFKYFFTIPCN